MNAAGLAHKARKHWPKYLPKLTAELRAANAFHVETMNAAKRAMRDAQEMMRAGFREHEAEEVVLREYILLPPEPGANLEPEEAEELQALEAEHRAMMRDAPPTPKHASTRYCEAFPPAEDLAGMLKQASLTGQREALEMLLEKALARGSRATESEIKNFMRLPRNEFSPLGPEPPPSAG